MKNTLSSMALSRRISDFDRKVAYDFGDTIAGFENSLIQLYFKLQRKKAISKETQHRFMDSVGYLPELPTPYKGMIVGNYN